MSRDAWTDNAGVKFRRIAATFHCSSLCISIGAVTLDSARERFWEKVEMDGPTVPGMTLPCWEWNATLDDRGYPRFKLAGVSMYANRALFALEGGALSQEDQVVTLCRNRRCVRPEHHIIGTESDARQLAHGGPICPNYQMLVRQHVRRGEMDVDDIAMCFGVSLQVAEAVIAEGRRG